jgi:hypothetical protein
MDPKGPLARAQASVRHLSRAGRIDQPTAFNEALLGFLRAGGLTGLRGPRSALLLHIVGSRDRSHIVWPGVYGRATSATRRLGLSTCRRRRAIALSDSSCRSGQAVHEAAWLSGVGAGPGRGRCGSGAGRRACHPGGLQRSPAAAWQGLPPSARPAAQPLGIEDLVNDWWTVKAMSTAQRMRAV